MSSAEVSVVFKPHDETTFQLQIGASEISIPGTSTRTNLDKLLTTTLLVKNENDENFQKQDEQNFTYIIGNQIFNSENLSQHILIHNLNTESAVEIIFFLKVDQPKPRLAYPHDDWVSSIDINDQFIVSSTFEGIVHIWSLEEDEIAKKKNDQFAQKIDNSNKNKDFNFKAHSQSVKCVKFLNHSSNPNAFITASSDQTCVIWDVVQRPDRASTTSKSDRCLYKVMPLYKLKGHTEQVEAAASSHSHIVTASADRMIKLWDASLKSEISDEADRDTGNESQNDIDGRDSHLPDSGLADDGHDADGQPAAKKSAGASTQKGKPRNPLMTISGHSAIITDILFENHGRRRGAGSSAASSSCDTVFTSSLDHSFRLWDVEIAKQKNRIQTAKAILSLDENEDCSSLATGSTDRHVRIYDKKDLSKAVVNNLSYHQGWISSVKFNPKNKFQLMSTSYDKEAVLWDIRSGKEPLYCLEAHKDRVYCSAWAENGILATGGADCNMTTWKV